MNPHSQALYEYLDSALPEKTTQEEIEYACKHIFCTLDGLPEYLQGYELSKENIAESFASWSRKIGMDHLQENYWMEVQLSILKDAKTLDLSKPLPFRKLPEQTASANPHTSGPQR